MKTTVTIANLKPRLWGVWSTTTHDLVGFIEQHQRGGFWYVRDKDGQRIDGISQCRTFDYARKCARVYRWER